MGLRESIKQRIKRNATRESVPNARQASKRARQGASRARERAAALQAHLEALDAGESPQDEDDVRSQAARAEEAATMTAPVNARLDPIDVPHPYEPEQERGAQPRTRRPQDEDEPTMEDLVLGTGMDDAEQSSEKEFRLFEPADDSDEDSFFGRL